MAATSHKAVAATTVSVVLLVALCSRGASALSAVTTPAKRTAFRDGGGATKEAAVAVGRTSSLLGPVGPRDVVVRCYDISNDGSLAGALSVATAKRVHWFPKLTVGVGGRSWAYDGEIERTSNEVVAGAAGPPVFEFNLGPCVYDDAGVDAVLEGLEGDYNDVEYDFFFRNCNHFADDVGRRLSGGNEVERSFLDEFVLRESESLLCNMVSFQRDLTMAVTRQIQKIVIVSWRRSWKRALAEGDAAKRARGESVVG